MDDFGHLRLDREPVFFLLKKGKMQTLLKRRIEELNRRRLEINGWLKEIDPKAQIRFSLTTGCAEGLIFSQAVHPQFRKPNASGVSIPKKGTKWHAVFSAQAAMQSDEDEILDMLGIHGFVDYSKNPEGDCEYMSSLGLPGYTCGFLFISSKGQYGMWIVDIPGYVAELKERGFHARGPDGDFTFGKLIELGCERSTEAEWNLLVAKYRVKQQKASKGKT